MKHLNWLSIILLFVLVFVGIFSINAVLELREENKALSRELDHIKNANLMNQEIFQQTEGYLRALMKGDASEYLTERYKGKVEQMDYGSSYETAKLVNLDIYNISVQPKENETYTVYAIYFAQLGGVNGKTDNPAHYQSMLLTTKIEFVPENGEYKVDDSWLQPIETSSDFFNELLQDE